MSNPHHEEYMYSLQAGKRSALDRMDSAVR